MEIGIIIAIAAIAIGIAIAWTAGRNAKREMESQKALAQQQLEAERQQMQQALEAEKTRAAQELEAGRQRYQQAIEAEREKALQALDAERSHHAQAMETERAHTQQLVDAERKKAQELIDAEKARAKSERENFERMYQESNRNWDLKFETMKKELLRTSAEQMVKSSEELRRSNDSNLTDLLKPLKEQFESFRKAVDETRTQSEVSKKAIEDRFAETMKVFQLQQDSTIRQLKEETARIGNDAVALAKALKSNSKRQGNWGEMVLQTMLENSGLEENVHFFVQYNVKDEDGKTCIPDVVVKFPEGRSVIIDSKVSLTAYTEYFETDDDERQALLLKNHLQSVEKHIDELSIKNYPRVVDNSMDYVMMFIPNESSYVAALKLNPNLLSYAYDRKVIVVSPNNLVMALQLAFNLWQTDTQVKNLEKIVARGKALYEKVYNFQRTFMSLGEQMAKMQAAYDTASKQLSTGPGNVIRQCEMLSHYGINVDSKKRLHLSEDDQAEMEMLEE